MSTGGKETNRQNREKEDFSFLQSLTDEELDDLLDAAAAEENPDENSALIETILDEWKRREEGLPENLPDAARIEASFAHCKARIESEGLPGTNEKSNSSPDLSSSPSSNFDANPSPNVNTSSISASGQNKHRTHKKFFAVAACLLLVFVISLGFSINASADGYGFWDKLVAWTKETFHFNDGRMPKQEIPNVQEKILLLFTDLDKALKENGIEISLPTWVPEGYKAKNVSVSGDGDTKIVIGWFEKELDWFFIQISTADDDKSWTQANFEENQGQGEVYVFGNVEHYITANEMDGIMRYSAVWRQSDYEIRLQGDLSKEEMRNMINSVYERI